MRPTASGDSQTGQRERNEDRFGIAPDRGLFVVADGMGGYFGGEVASRLAVETIDDCFLERSPTTPAQDLMDIAFREANEEVRCARVDELEDMGSTLSALAITAREAVIGHVGDSRVYMLRRGELRRITRDHTVIESLKAVGIAGPSLQDVFGHMITKAIGVQEELAPDLIAIEIEAGDRFLLCTDGLTDVVDDEAIAEILGSGSASSACSRLTMEALRRGTKDNVTALVVDIDRDSSEPAHATPHGARDAPSTPAP
jgi:serine/threonine protein phosphatase PrpC